MVNSDARATGSPNGAALAGFMAAGIGAFALGIVVLLNEAGAFTVPAIYGPAGGVSGRTTLAVVVWLASWAVLHRRWRAREVAAGRVHMLTVILTGLGVLLNFPPVWRLL